MNGALIYNKKDIDKNSWFINKIIEGFKSNNIKVELLDEELIDFNNINFAFGIYRGRNFKIVQKLQKFGVQMFNNDYVSMVANDKYETYKLLKNLKINHLKTSKNSSVFNEFPIVAKTRNGHGGEEVFLVNSPAELQYINEKYNNLIFQEYIKEGNVDTRIYMIGNEPVVAIERTADSGFKSNFSLGGSVKEVKINNSLKRICKKIQKEIKSDFIGIDVFYKDGKYIVNEIEDPVGCRMVYKITNIDIIELCISKYISALQMK